MEATGTTTSLHSIFYFLRSYFRTEFSNQDLGYGAEKLSP